jgi:hypothetical protein
VYLPAPGLWQYLPMILLVYFLRSDLGLAYLTIVSLGLLLHLAQPVRHGGRGLKLQN